MGQRKSWDSEPGLRQYLLDWQKGFRHEMCSTFAENADWSSTAWAQLSHSVDTLASGGEYRCHGYELPDDHSARGLGVQLDWVLGVDDALRAVS